MPDTHHHSEEGIENEEHDELQRKYEARIEEARKNLGLLFDDAKRRNVDPIDEVLRDDMTKIREVYGGERVDAFIASIKAVGADTKEQFIEEVMQAAHFLFYERYFNPEVKQILDSYDQERRERNRVEGVRFGKLEGKIHTSEWQLALPDKSILEKEDRVLEISWPDEADPEKPKGIHDIQESFTDIADYLASHPEIKAVVAVSWMMSKGVAERLGFTRYPDVHIEEAQRQHILHWVESARKDKPQQGKPLTTANVMLGAIPRDEFLRRFEKK